MCGLVWLGSGCIGCEVACICGGRPGCVIACVRGEAVCPVGLPSLLTEGMLFRPCIEEKPGS